LSNVALSNQDKAVIQKQSELTAYMGQAEHWKTFVHNLSEPAQRQLPIDLFAYVQKYNNLVSTMPVNEFMAQVIIGYSKGLTLRDGEMYIYKFGATPTLVEGYLGVVRLAMESGLFKTFDCVPCIAESMIGYDARKGVPKFNDNYIPNGTEKTVGFLAYFETHDGLVREEYKSVQWLKDFAKDKSSSYSKKDSPWQTDFDAMARKTMLKRLFKLAPKNNRNANTQAFYNIVDMGENRPDNIDDNGVIQDVPFDTETQVQGGRDWVYEFDVEIDKAITTNAQAVTDIVATINQLVQTEQMTQEMATQIKTTLQKKATDAGYIFDAKKKAFVVGTN
jgi:phage RecT family recombinase